MPLGDWSSTLPLGVGVLAATCQGVMAPCPLQIAVQNPLVSERLELSVLYKEYAEDDNIYQQKIKVGASCAAAAWGWAGAGLLQTALC